VRVLLFDIDGTLIRAGGAGRLALMDAMRSAFAIEDPCCKISFSGRTDGFLLRQVLRENGVEPTVAHYQTLIEHYLCELPVCLRRCEGAVLPGVLPLLERLRRLPELHIGCMTGNLAASARMKLQHFALWTDHFEQGHLFAGDDCEQRDHLAQSAAVELAKRFAFLRDVWVIGDTPHDVQCGRAIGAKVLACCTGEHRRDEMQQHRPDYLVDDLQDTDMLAELLTR